MKRKLPIAACIALLVLSAALLFVKCSSDRLLRTVNLQASALRQVDYTYFNDYLKYTDGYEIAAFTVRDSNWVPPEGWVMLDSMQPIDELALKLGIKINTDKILDLSLGGADCSSYCIVDNRSAQPFEEQDYYFAYCDDTYSGNPVIFIYRGHHLYGL